VAREFGLKEPLARELVMEQTRQTLLRSKVAWSVLLAGFAVVGWLYLEPAQNRDTALRILAGTVVAWLLVGRYLAGQAIRRAAREKAHRIRAHG
jgi:hypothetical protein